MYKRIKDNLQHFLNYLVAIYDKELHRNIYKYSSYVSVVLILITYSGFLYIKPAYISLVHNFFLFYVCLTLLIRFNPLIKKNNLASSVEFNRNVAFTAGIILFTTTVFNNVLELYSRYKR